MVGTFQLSCFPINMLSYCMELQGVQSMFLVVNVLTSIKNSMDMYSAGLATLERNNIHMLSYRVRVVLNRCPNVFFATCS